MMHHRNLLIMTIFAAMAFIVTPGWTQEAAPSKTATQPAESDDVAPSRETVAEAENASGLVDVNVTVTVREDEELTTAQKARLAAEAQHVARMTPFVEAVRQAASVSAAAKAYSRGNAIDNRYAPLHDAYMKRMLTFGLPHIAAYPAKVLVRIAPDNGTAWGVLGYMHGRENELAEAMSASVRAAKLKPDDPSIMNNVGQLLAWYRQVLALPDLPDRDKRAIDLNEEEWIENEMFARAYNRIHVAFEEQKSLDTSAARQLAATEAAVLALHRHALDIDAQLLEVREDIATHKRLLYVYRSEYLRGAPVFISVDRDGRHGGPGSIDAIIYPTYYPGRLRRAELEARIIEEEQVIDELQAQANALYREGRKVVAELKDKRSKLAEVRDQSMLIRERLLRQFRWDPPAVNGVVTDEREHLPPPPRTAGPELPTDAETQATQKLNLAKAYRASGMEDRAREILQTLIEDWPDTSAARQARRLLGE